MPRFLLFSRSRYRRALCLSCSFAWAAFALPALTAAQWLSVAGAVELYEPADQAPPLGDPTSNQYFGGALAVGNFNGDLYQDLAIGIPEDTGGPILSRRAKAGTVAVIYGGPAGLNMANAGYISQPWTGADPVVQEPGDHFGCALAAGDFDNDGVDDLAVGVCNETIGVAAEAGVVNIFYGVLFGSMGNPDLTLTEPSPVAGRHLGLALAAGDINGDGADELVMAQAAGQFYFLYGSPGGLATSGTAWNLGPYMGMALGDFNGDGFADFAVGGPTPGWTAGEAFVWHGSAAGLVEPVASWLRQDFMVSDALDGGNEAGDRFGESLLAADLDNDGYEDLVIGAPGEDVGPEGSEFVDAGALYVLRGGVGGLDPGGAHYWTENGMVSQTLVADGDGFATSFAAGDADDDGYLELAVGSPFKTASGQPQAGLVILMPGSSSGPTDLGVARVWQQDSPSVPDGSEPNDRFGRALAFGDFDGNGRADLAIAAPDEDDGVGHSDLGAVTVLRGCLFCDGFEAGGFGVPSPVAWSTLAP
ncbi:MAG: FG-GAP and VCBS repeat-containing protein [Thermoanaerobaculia bacterium]